MLTIISITPKIQFAQTQFTQLIQAALPEKISCTVSGVGGGYQDAVAYSADLDLWYSFQAEEKKFWNGLGIGKPIENKKVALASEINFPIDGINRSISGCFAEDENGKIFVLHRGKIRGGKAIFFEHFSGQTVEAQDGNKSDTFALIGELNDHLAQNLAAFVREVLRIKAVMKN